ncbi:hypothetical protein NLG97_g10556 [Lecanicillium saksenae]|uniref:Uncharacterized protein n=1 Tax=Lecanicillium saksenae TaxID=468837 RepID=A0ACC1QFB7_9HYPO|nr:hypothetical protein NLG97_g10556 [Lecanicillium saksenae]
MEDYLFRTYVQECRVVQEETKYVEIFNYSDPFHNSCEEHPLTPDEFENFLHRRGAFAPPDLRLGTTLLSGIRLVVQTDAKDKDTFMPKVLSLPKESYEQMVRVLRLPFRGIETTSVVGPFFWTSYDHDDADPHLRMLPFPPPWRDCARALDPETDQTFCHQTSCTGNPTSAKRAGRAAGR